MVETDASAKPRIEDWAQAPWRKLEQHVYRLQKRIYRAQQSGNVKAVHSLQRLLLKSRAARMLAVRRVTQDNQGKKTAGIDGVKAVGRVVRLRFVEQLKHAETIKAQPVRRVMIPKAGKPHEKRPLGIPVLLDRAHQALVKLALEPQWEARFEPDSYGFHPGRCCQDAVHAISQQMLFTPKYVLDADIRGAFDNISQSALLAKLNTIPVIYRGIKAWLRAGVMTNGTLEPTVAGTPQGSVISPLRLNIALHGIQMAVETAYKNSNGKTRYHPCLIRYADDLVVLCRDLEGIEKSREVLERWLEAMGLQLSPTKTRITHTLHPHNGNVGFDFLGFHFQQYPAGRCHATRFRGKKTTGLTLHITASKEAVSRHLQALNRIARKMRAAKQEDFIRQLNAQIRGWSRYYRHVETAKTFSHCGNAVYSMLRHWSRRRHPGKSARWTARRYWHQQGKDRWCFCVPDGNRLQRHSETKHERFIKVRGEASPYDGNLIYWSQRLKTRWVAGSQMGRLLQLQRGICAECGLTFRDGDRLEIHHIIPLSEGGTNHWLNTQALHVHCHDQLTARQLAEKTITGVKDNDRTTEDLCKLETLMHSSEDESPLVRATA